MADPAFVESPVSLKTSLDRSKEKVHIIGISMGGMIAQASWKIHQFFDEKILIFPYLSGLFWDLKKPTMFDFFGG